MTFAQEQEMMIKQIEFLGNKKMNAQTLLSKFNLKEGDSFSPEAVQAEIKNLYLLGLFEQVTAETLPFEGGIAVRFTVRETPILSEIAFSGNETIRTNTLTEKLSLKAERPLDRNALANDLKMIVDRYQKEGYFHVVALPILNFISDEQVSLTFLITENEQSVVKKIRFDGLVAFKEDTVKKELLTKEYAWYRFFDSESERYQEATVAADQERLKEFYLNRGYLAQVGKPIATFNADDESVEITFSILEGNPFTIEKVSYEGNKVIESDVLLSTTTSQASARFSKQTVASDIQKIKDLYGARGYLFANVTQKIVPDLTNSTMILTFVISEGNPHTIRNINIYGNDKTRDKVIRREFRQNEQETVNTQLLRRAFQRLHNLNFFENIDIVPKRVGDDQVDIDIEVQEKSTGTLSLGGGYSSVDRFVGQFEVNQGNLFGRGHLLRASSEFGGRRTAYSLTFREPYLFDSTFSLQGDIFNRSRELSSYKEKRKGGDIILGKSFGEHIRNSVSYTLETLLLSDVSATTAPLFIQEQAALGNTVTSAIGFTMTQDTRDFVFDPKEGSRHSLSLEYAGTFLGGDNAYYKASFESGHFFRAWRDEVFALHGKIGFAEGLDGKALPVGERFFVGGINTVRGFRFGKAGPITNGVVTGGNKELYFNAEYLIPIQKESGLKLVLFYDIGAAFDDGEPFAASELRQGAGGGIRFLSPLGPLRLEWGWNLHSKPGESKTEFEFSIGTLF